MVERFKSQRTFAIVSQEDTLQEVEEHKVKSKSDEIPPERNILS